MIDRAPSGEPKPTERAPSGDLLKASNLIRIGEEVLILTGLTIPGGEPNQIEVFRTIDPFIAKEIDRHTSKRTPWVPHDYMPIDNYGRLIPFNVPGREPPLSSAVVASMIVNQFTEDNIPSYLNAILSALRGTALEDWAYMWAAEESNHDYALRSTAELSGMVDPKENTMARYEHMKKGYRIERDPFHTIVYTSFQELATQGSYQRTKLQVKAERHSEEKTIENVVSAMLGHISTDENFHMQFYSNVGDYLFEVAPNQMMQAVRDEVMSFEMPGSNITNFKSKSLEIANAGIYDLRIHLEKVIMPILRKWRVFERDDLSGFGAQARDELALYLDHLGVQATKFDEQRDSGRITNLIEILRKKERI